MKKLFYLFAILVAIPFSSNASHLFGGEITWKCLSSGKYQFFMSVYRDCIGIPWTFRDETIDIIGAPLPLDRFGQPVNSIVVKPDSNRMANENNGDLTLFCDPQSGTVYSCSNGDLGTQQIFYYKSDPINDPIDLFGTPPNDGWRFFWEGRCCWATDFINTSSLIAGRIVLLRTVMYSTGSSSNACSDSSPEFIDPPTVLFCRDKESNYSQSAIDKDFDSLIYRWEIPISPPKSSPQNMSYSGWYTASYPTPGTREDVRNISARVNNENGITRVANYSQVGGDRARFITSISVDAYRNGIKNATISRTIPISFINCPTLLNGQQNKSPQIIFNGLATNEYELDIIAGQRLEIPIQVSDGDVKDVNGNQQKISLQMNGSSFNTAFSPDSVCNVPGNEPCAYLQNLTPHLDTTIQPVRYKLEGIGQVSTNLNWQTNCGHLDNNGSSKTYYFYFKAQDDNCPIPESSVATIKVTVHPSGPVNHPQLNCIDRVGNDNKISWSQSVSAIDGFEEVQIYRAATRNGNYTLISTITDSTAFSYTDINAASTVYYFIRVKSRDCNSGFSVSAASDKLANSNLNLSAIDTSGIGINLKWNYFTRKMGPTDKYIIYRELQIGSGFEKLDSVYNDSTFCDKLNDCSGRASYYIERENENLNCTSQSNVVTIDYAIKNLGLSLSVTNTPNCFQLNWSGKGATDVKYSIYREFPFASGFVKIDSVFNDSSYCDQLNNCTGLVSYYIERCNSQSNTAILLGTNYSINNELKLLGQTFVATEENASYQWYSCSRDSLFKDSIGRTFSPQDTGVYKVIINKFGCQNTSDCITLGFVGLKENEFSESISIYPNPSKGSFYINGLNKSDNYSIQIRNIRGQLIKESSIQNSSLFQIELNQKAGVYFIQLINSKGEQAYLKVVKK